MGNKKVCAMPFAKVYPLLVAKAIRKGRTQAEVDEIITWLTGYSIPQIEGAVQNETSYITPPACAAFAVEQANELLFHFTSAVRTDSFAGSHSPSV